MLKPAKYTSSNSGFTLVEILIATGILSVLMLGFTSYLFYQSRMGKIQDNKQNLNYVQSSILNAAGQEETLSHSEKISK